MFKFCPSFKILNIIMFCIKNKSKYIKEYTSTKTWKISSLKYDLNNHQHKLNCPSLLLLLMHGFLFWQFRISWRYDTELALISVLFFIIFLIQNLLMLNFLRSLPVKDLKSVGTESKRILQRALKSVFNNFYYEHGLIHAWCIQNESYGWYHSIIIYTNIWSYFEENWWYWFNK